MSHQASGDAFRQGLPPLQAFPGNRWTPCPVLVASHPTAGTPAQSPYLIPGLLRIPHPPPPHQNCSTSTWLCDAASNLRLNEKVRPLKFSLKLKAMIYSPNVLSIAYSLIAV